MKYYKGRFTPKNPQKYKGNPTNIIYRSLWERNLMSRFDIDPNILEWNSEEFFVLYRTPLDPPEKIRRYFPDFWVKMRNRNGIIVEKVIEVKPKAQTQAPKGKRITKKLLTETERYVINDSKWEAARKYCAKRGWEFVILTEDDLFKP